MFIPLSDIPKKEKKTVFYHVPKALKKRYFIASLGNAFQMLQKLS